MSCMGSVIATATRLRCRDMVRRSVHCAVNENIRPALPYLLTIASGVESGREPLPGMTPKYMKLKQLAVRCPGHLCCFGKTQGGLLAVKDRSGSVRAAIQEELLGDMFEHMPAPDG